MSTKPPIGYAATTPSDPDHYLVAFHCLSLAVSIQGVIGLTFQPNLPIP